MQPYEAVVSPRNDSHSPVLHARLTRRKPHASASLSHPLLTAFAPILSEASWADDVYELLLGW